MSEDTTTETASQADTSEHAAPAVEENPSGDNSAAGVDHAAENVDLRAMLAHYAPDLDVDVAINDYFNRAGKFTPPTPATPEVNTKPQPNRKRALTTTRKTSQPKTYVAPTVPLNSQSGNVNSVEAHKIAAELSAMTPAERTAMLANVKVTP